MDRPERMKRIIAFVVVVQMQTQTLMIQLLIIAFVYLRTRRRSGRVGSSQAESDSDMDEQVHQEDDQQVEVDAIGMFDEALDESQSTSMTSTAQNLKRKKPCSPRVSPDVALFKKLCDTIKYAIERQGKSLEALARAIAAPEEVKNVGQTLKNLGFNDDEIVTAALKFSDNPTLEKCLWALTDAQKVVYVRSILSK